MIDQETCDMSIVSTSDMLHILSISVQQAGVNNLSTNVDFIIQELLKKLSMHNTEDLSVLVRDVNLKLSLDRLHLMLKISSCNNKHADGELNAETGYHLATICIGVLNAIAQEDSGENCVAILCNILHWSLCDLEKKNVFQFWEVIRSTMNESKNALNLALTDSMFNANVFKELPSADLLKITIHFKVIETFIDALLSSGSIQHQGFQTNIQKILNNGSMHSLILSIIIQANKNVASHVLLGVIPKLVKCASSNLLLDKIWTHLLSDTVSLPQVFLVLCSLADYYIPESSHSESSSINRSLVQESAFWKLLQNGLLHNNDLLRKQALYLTKRAVYQISQSNKLICTKDDICIWDPLNSKELNHTWEHCFLILETLEEKQIHLINPVLPVVEKFIKASSSECLSFHSTWVLCTLQRILKHDNVSIVKWGVLHLIQLDLLYFQLTDSTFSTMKLLISTLNNANLFAKTTDQISFKVGEGLIAFFTNLTHLPLEARNGLFALVIQFITVISWDPIPLFYVVHALASVPTTPLWSTPTLLALRMFITDALGTQSVFIRGGIQCELLRAITNLSDVSSLDLATVADILGCFEQQESLKRGTHSWTRTVAWLQTFVLPETALNHIARSLSSVLCNNATNNKSIDAKTTARIILLLSDAGLLDFNSFGDNSNSASGVLQQALHCFDNSGARLYSCEQKQDAVLELVVQLLQGAEIVNAITTNPPSTKALVSVIKKHVHEIFLYIKQRIMSITHLRDFYTLHLYFDGLQSFANDINFHSDIGNIIETFQTMAIQLAAHEQSDTVKQNDDMYSPLHEFSAMRILVWVSHCLKRGVVDCHTIAKNQHDFVGNMIKTGGLNRAPGKKQIEQHLTRDLQMLWGKLVADYLQGTWGLFALYLDFDGNISSVDHTSSRFYTESLECLEIGGRSVLIDVMKVFGHVLPRISDETQIVTMALELIASCWKATFELRKIELFWVAIRQFIRMIYQSHVINKLWIHERLREYASEIFVHSRSVLGLANVLMVQLQEQVTDEQIMIFSECLIEALLFGPIHRRDQKFEDDTAAFIRQLGKECSVNELVSSEDRLDNKVRAIGVDLLLRIVNNSNCSQAAAELAECVFQRDRDETSRKIRYFGDSYVHRIKHRIMQVLLLVEPVLPKDDRHKLMSWLSNSLLTENHQPSVRYQQEWLLARVLLHSEQARMTMWQVFRSAAQVRPGSMCSFVAVSYLVACSLHLSQQEMFIYSAMEMTLPWCMAQHFNVRIYAQVTMKKLWEISKTKNLTKVLKDFAIIISSLQISVDHGNAFKNAQKLQEDFYLNVFDPQSHFTLATIYSELPRLANLSPDELISVEVFMSCGLSNLTGLAPLSNKDDRLEQHSIGAWVLKSSGGDVDENVSSVDVPYNIQKKIIPWKEMFPEQDLLLGSKICSNPKKRPTNGGLIVVASLIDRPPNLGGLCRTCEVFGVSEYILSNLKYMDDKQFQSLSVSAERWIPISEVKQHLLSKYLTSMKQDGYTLVGAEQTTNSVKINEMQFPKKTLLLLGNEKEGIPAEFLPLLDVCVAIPQQGLVRSLNVHVTGAIFIWEYSRQHNLQEK